MSNIVVVDDQAVKPNSAGRIPVIEFYPPIPDGWVTNGMCVGCNITHSTAQELLYRTVTGGTWTNAWWVSTIVTCNRVGEKALSV